FSIFACSADQSRKASRSRRNRFRSLDPSGYRISTSQRFVSGSHIGPFEKSRFLRGSSMTRSRFNRTTRYVPVKHTSSNANDAVAVLDHVNLSLANPMPQGPGPNPEVVGGINN